jgi:hypothetical protein
VLVLCIAKNTNITGSGFSSEVTGVTDEGNNSWIKVDEYTSAYGSNSGTTVAVFFTKATNSPGVVTVSFSDVVSSKAAEVRRFAATGNVGVQTYEALAVLGQPGSITLNVPTGEYLWLRAIASRYSNTETWDHTSGYTGFNRAGTSTSPLQSIGGEFIIATGESQTSNPTTSESARRASLFIAFKETTATKSSSDASTLSGDENLQLSRDIADSGTLTSVESETTEKQFTATDTGTFAAIEGEQKSILISEYDSGVLSALEGQSLEFQCADVGTLSAIETQSLEGERAIDDTDTGIIGGVEQLTLARDPADTGTLLSVESLVFERTQADAGTISADEARTVERALADAVNELFGYSRFGETLFGGEPRLQKLDPDNGTLSAVEQLTLARDPADEGTLLSVEALVFERTQADVGTISAAEAQSLEVERAIDNTDTGTLLSVEALVFERTQADVGTISIAKALTLARALDDTGILAAGETTTRSTNVADTGVLASAEAQSTNTFAFKTPTALRVTNYLRRTV